MSLWHVEEYDKLGDGDDGDEKGSWGSDNWGDEKDSWKANIEKRKERTTSDFSFFLPPSFFIVAWSSISFTGKECKIAPGCSFLVRTVFGLSMTTMNCYLAFTNQSRPLTGSRLILYILLAGKRFDYCLWQDVNPNFRDRLMFTESEVWDSWKLHEGSRWLWLKTASNLTL